MRKKLTVAIVLLLLFSEVAYGVPPSALGIFRIIYNLEPGTNVEIAYDMLGSPQRRTWRIFMIPPALRWDITTDRTIIVFLRDNSTIGSSIYYENYNQMESALQRYKEIKEAFHEILDAAGARFREFEHGTAWSIGNSVFGVEYKKVNYFLSSKHRVSALFVPRTE